MPRKSKGKSGHKEPQADNGRKALFDEQFLKDVRYWIESDSKTVIRLVELVDAVVRNPFTGIGKPEPLKFLGADIWSRRLTQEHRVVYMVREDRVDFLQGRFHY